MILIRSKKWRGLLPRQKKSPPENIPIRVVRSRVSVANLRNKIAFLPIKTKT